jgi:NAD(P)-dependent dehydrogenase (short-subunit alcohol dehydrogenase family)
MLLGKASEATILYPKVSEPIREERIMVSFDGLSVVITGASSGIGLATAKRFSALGARLLIAGKEKAEVDAAVAAVGGEAIGFVGDVSSYEDNERMVRAAVDAYGGIDRLILNAGVFDGFLPLEETDLDLFSKVLDVNVKGYFLGAKASLEALKKSKGAVVMTASSAGFHSQQGGLAYTASKHAIVGMIRELAFELAAHGIRVNGVAPGGTPTELRNAVKLGQEFGDDRSLFDNPDVMGFIAATTPLGKAGSAEEVANAIAYLASDAASHTTGHVLRVDGGYAIRGVPAP